MERLVRPEVLAVHPYAPSNPVAEVKLDANESPYGWENELWEKALSQVRAVDLNRYPDSSMAALISALTDYTGAKAEQVTVGVGSDELLERLLQTFVKPGESVLMPWPTFSMYAHFARLQGAEAVTVPMTSDYQVDPKTLLTAIDATSPKVIFLCSPNNPTGAALPTETILQVLKAAPGIVVVDEAYYEFAGESVIDLINEWPNLIVLRTLSKAFGLAALRVGYLIASDNLVGYIRRTQPPYHLNSISQVLATLALNERERILRSIPIIVAERERVGRSLTSLPGVTVYPSSANFLLVRLPSASAVVTSLAERGIAVRPFGHDARLTDCLRVSIGRSQENDRFLTAITELLEMRA